MKIKDYLKSSWENLERIRFKLQTWKDVTSAVTPRPPWTRPGAPRSDPVN